MANAREKQILNNCIGYLCELWDNMDEEEYINQWVNIIGLTKEEIEQFDLSKC